MQLLTGPRVFVTLVAVAALGVIFTLDSSRVTDRHQIEVFARTSQYTGDYTSAYAHFRNRGDASDIRQSEFSFYQYPAYQKPLLPNDERQIARQLNQLLTQTPTAAGETDLLMLQRQALLGKLKAEMYEHAGRLEYEQAALLRDRIRELEGQ